MTRVLVADDHPLIRAGLAALLRDAPRLAVVGEAATGVEAVAVTVASQPDVVLMDVGLGTTAVTERIAGLANVLLLTTVDQDEYVRGALRAGASGLMCKNSPPDRLLAAIHAVAAGHLLFEPAAIHRMADACGERTQPAAAIDLTALTARELEVLRLVGQGLVNAAIAGQLAVTENTAKTHLHRAMSKLRLASRAQAVVVAYEAGLVVPGRVRGWDGS